MLTDDELRRFSQMIEHGKEEYLRKECGEVWEKIYSRRENFKKDYEMCHNALMKEIKTSEFWFQLWFLTFAMGILGWCL